MAHSGNKMFQDRLSVGFRQQRDLRLTRGFSKKGHCKRHIAYAPKFQREQARSGFGFWRRLCQAKGVRIRHSPMTSRSPAQSDRSPPDTGRWIPALGAGIVAVVLLHLWGNAVRGYIGTTSLFEWWFFQLLNPASEAEHGWLILGLSAWLLWRNVRAARGDTADGDAVWPAVVAFVGGLALHALGFVAQQTRISIVGFLLILWGVFRLGGGIRWGRAAAFPIGFLVFAIPVNVLDSVGFWLRVWVVDASSAIAHGAGIAVLRNGTQLLAPDGSYNYDVAAACSGVRSLTALAALSLLAGYLCFRGICRRALVFAACFPLVYLGNVARIVAIIIAADAGGPRWGDIAHEVMGYGVFAIVLGGVLGWASLLERLRPEASAASDERRGSARTKTSGLRNLISDKLGEPSARSVANAWAVAAGFLVLAGAAAFFLRKVATRPSGVTTGVMLSGSGIDPVELPSFIGTEWIGRRAEVSAVEREILPADTGYSRKTYVAVADPRRQVFLSIVLSGRDRTSIHRPELCLVGQGWTIADSERRTLAITDGEGDFAGGRIPFTLLRVKREFPTPRGRESVPQLVAYFFIGADGVVGGHADMVRRDAWNRVRHGRADRWAYLLMQADARDGEAAALARMEYVLRGVWPVLVPLPAKAPATGQP